MNNNEPDPANAKRGALHNCEPGSYRFQFLMEACKEARIRFHATPEYKKLREDMTGRKSSEILRAIKKLRQELEPERKFCEFDEETTELLHQRTRDKILAALKSLPPGVYRMRDSFIIVGKNPKAADDTENAPESGA